MRGFLNRSKGLDVGSQSGPTVKLDRGQRCLSPNQLRDLCHHIHSLIRTDHAFLTDLEKRVREGTNTEFVGSQYKSSSRGGCCSKNEEDKLDSDRMIEKIVEADDSMKRGLPGATGPTKQQLDDLVHTFQPREQLCCTKIRFQYVDNDLVGEVLERNLGSVNEDMANVMIEVMELAQRSYANVLKDIDTQKEDDQSENDPQPESSNEFVKKLEGSTHPLLKDFQAMLGKPSKLSKPLPGSAEDKFSRQMVMKESLVKVVRKRVSAELAKRHKVDGSTGGLTATPGGWTLCPLDFISSDALSQLFKKSESLNYCVINNFVTAPPGALSDLKRMDNDGVLRPVGTTTRLRRGWMAIEGFNQAEFPILTQLFLRLGSIPFEINKKCGFHLQIPSDFLFERTYLHSPNEQHHESVIDQNVLNPRARLECGDDVDSDNGRALVAVFCLEEPKIRSNHYISHDQNEKEEVKIELTRNQMIIYPANGIVSRVEHCGNEGQDGVLSTITLFLKGLLK
eukprot:GHVH01000337.1.p1 GENE.GHVH01000337.1~~GHVH01000337.1.p1  ORF type:complete len:509 (+),score=71.36 GHVH01000337.1:142-1668(+)